MSTEYQICSRCIMDTSDPGISFNESGICCHCFSFDLHRKPTWFPNKKGRKLLDAEVANLKSRRSKQQYDCMIGLSGGVDSSYLAYFLKKEYNLRMLAVHVDGGWNSEIAVSNIENIVKKLDIDLFTHVVDWQEMKKLQVAFLRSGVVNQDTPQDHAFFAGLYMAAVKFKIKDFYVGQNVQTESVLPRSWQGLTAMDSVQLRFIARKFGDFRVKKFPVIDFFKHNIYLKYIYKLKQFAPLNYLPYKKENAKKLIISELDWRDYGVKHGESKWTKFFQSYFLVEKAGFDKRRAHLSSLVLAGQIERDKALDLMKEPIYSSERELFHDIEYVAKKLCIDQKELLSLISQNCIEYKTYPNADCYRFIMRILSRIKNIF